MLRVFVYTCWAIAGLTEYLFFMQTSTRQVPRYEFWICYAIFFALAFLCYAPVLTPGYAFSDDFYHLAMFTRMQNCYHELMVCSCLQGRPMLGVVLGLAMGQMHRIADFAYMRLFGIFAASAVALCAYFLMRANGWRRVPAASLSLACIAVPGFQIFTAWSVTSTFILPMLGAFFAVDIAKDLGTLSTARARSNFAIATIAQFLAICIYQPTAMFFWFFASICLFNFEAWTKEKTRRLINFFLVFGFASATELIFFELAKHFLGTTGLLPQRSHLTSDLLGKAQWFVTNPLVDVLNLNRLNSSPKIALVVSLLLSVGMLLFFRGGVRARLLQFSLAICFLMLCYLPNLAIAENFATYRTQVAMEALIFFYCGLSFTGIVQTCIRNGSVTICSAGLIAFCLLNLLAAHFHVQTFFVTPQTLELNLVKAQLSGEFGPGLQKKPLFLTREESFAPFSRYDEFGLPSMAQTWVPEPACFVLSREQGLAGSGIAARVRNSVK
jgi:hypothetical protein